MWKVRCTSHREDDMGDPEVCILVSTCERYLPLARWTVERIRKSWANTPALFLCGAAGDFAESLPLIDDPRDWMGITLSAARELASRGTRWVYLILDDLPPVGPCNSRHLNEILPRLAREENAAHIGLLGWGQRRPVEGIDLGPKKFHLSRNNASYRWKFSLHPSLWSVADLITLLEARMKQYPAGQRTPWNFERHRDEPGGLVPEKLLASTFRINGLSMMGKNSIDLFRAMALFGFDVYRFLLRILAGQPARDRFDLTGLWLYHYYRGPYPILWSGAMRQGKPSIEFQNFLKGTGRRELLAEWDAVATRLSPSC